MWGHILAGDRRLMHHLNQWPAPLWIRRWMTWAARAGDGWLWIALGLLLLAFGRDRRTLAFTSGLLAVGAGLLTFFVLKRLFGRERPCALEAHCWSRLLPHDRFSFPSGHTISAFSITVPVGLTYPELMPVLLFCALSIAASRVILGLHYLTDVLAGIFLGTLLGIASLALTGAILTQLSL
jgi:undecaprenyl-diphosphatase